MARIEQIISNPEFWNKREESQSILRKRRQLEETLKLAEQYRGSLSDLETLIELHQEGEEVIADIEAAVSELERRIAETEIRTLLSGPHDENNAIVTIHPGAGGTESQDWAEMLLRMYLRWAEKNGYETEITDYQVGEEAGLKSVTFLVKGRYAYGHLSAEIGVHRLVRISPFDSAARRHTSFASVFVTPEIEEDIDIVVEDKDLRIDTYRSSGAGGQHVNVTDSAVRITHLPTGIVVQCQNERSQHRNKEVAMRILKSKLYELEMERKRKELDKLEAGKSDIAWGSQIRSYVLHPYKMVKDHRTKLETAAVDSVLDGNLDAFIEAYLHRKERPEGKAKASS
ncbi:MAG: peptide chain release factor 2 [Acidobacteria bacterium]|nr:peptide chain release factor 2 [Acidobacteriota bacterium]